MTVRATTAPFQPGNRVYRWVLVGSSGGGGYDACDIQPLTVVRVNRKTVTVRTDQGCQFRTDPANIAGYYTED